MFSEERRYYDRPSLKIDHGGGKLCRQEHDCNCDLPINHYEGCKWVDKNGWGLLMRPSPLPPPTKFIEE